MPEQPLLLNALWMQYHGEWLFKDFTVTFPLQQCTCLLGVNGVGKTTLLRMISGELKPHRGTIELPESNPKSLKFSYMTQQNNLLPWLTVKENIFLPFALRGERVDDQKEEKLKKIVNLLDLSRYLEIYPKAISVGVQQRVALARIVLSDADIVLLDEPFSAIDAVTRFKLQNLLMTLIPKKTIIFVTHDPFEALRIAHKIVVLKGFPAQVSEQFDLGETTPRNVSDRIVTEHYHKLMGSLALEAFEEIS